jgi:UDP-3-O-acyl-N-acetylglucosamine deacetylase
MNRNKIKEKALKADDIVFKETIKFLNGIKDIRLKGLYLHLIVENYINQIITKSFKHPNKILDSRYYSFHKKIEILKEIGIIDGTTFHNLKIVNNIRNYLTHNLHIPHSVIENEILKITFSKEAKLPPFNQEDRWSNLMELAFVELYKSINI